MSQGLDGLDRRVVTRAGYDRALEPARLAAYPPGEFVGQESFMRASEIRELASRAGIGPGISVLDLCCGVAGPGRFLASSLGCSYLGVDADADAIALASARAGDLSCDFTVGAVPSLPPGSFDVVLLLETMLVFPDKAELLRAVADSLLPGSRFAFTVEEGEPLTASERFVMPAADTVWPVPWPELLTELAAAGLEVQWVEDWTAAHRRTAEALTSAFVDSRESLVAELGSRAVCDLLASHRLWCEWLASGRVRKLAVVAEVPGLDGLDLRGGVGLDGLDLRRGALR